MISVFEVVVDPDMIAPQPFYIYRSTGQFVAGGFQPNNTIVIPMFGPVQQASNKEIQMLAEADRIGSVRSFWSTQPIYVTRGYAPVPGVNGEVPTEVSALVYSISSAPPDGVVDLYSAGLLLQPNGFDYALDGTTITFAVTPAQPLYVTWQVTVQAATNASDILQYETEQHRVMHVYRDPGSGYWKALADRMAAA